MYKVPLLVVLAAIIVGLGSGCARADRQRAIIYNAPPQWANWGVMLQSIQDDLGIAVPFDNKNSGQSLAQLIAEKNAPVADLVYYGSTFAIQAKKEGVIRPYKPARYEEIPTGLKDEDGYWIAVHFGTIGLFVNKDALGDIPVPQSWSDLLKPEYDGMVGFLDPSSAFVGYVGAIAVNQALGGDWDNFAPALRFFSALRHPIIPKQTAYARVLSGEIPILFDYDFNAYRAKYDDEANVEFIIPQEGSISVPYVMSLVAGAEQPENAQKILDYVLSDQGQAIWARAYLRPVIASAMPAGMAQKFSADYTRVAAVDYEKMAERYADFQKQYLGS